MTFDRLVAGTLVLPEEIVQNGWIGIRAGRIAAIGAGERPAAKLVDDYGGNWICPGVVDGQTHAGSYRGLPGIASTTRSALAGGITTIVDMPYDNPDPLNTVERLTAKRDAIGQFAHCDVALYGTVAPDQDVSVVTDLIAGGVCAIKISAFESHPQRFPRINTAQVLDLFELLAETDIPLGLHNEDQEIVRDRIARQKRAGRETIADHSDSRPEAAELAATAQFLELGAVAGAHAHLVHLSSPRGLRLVDRYAGEGYRATGELCVHYLFFDPDLDGARLGARLKVNPPIRPGMKEKLWAEVESGRVEFISSDHSSWPVDGKNTPSIYDAGAGVPGLETLLPAMVTGAVARWERPLSRVAYLLSEAPARFFGLYPQKGVIAIGADADLAVLEPGRFVWDSANAHDELNWSPFDGMDFSVRVAATYLRGEKAYADGNVLTPPGSGRFVPRISRQEQ
jgi:allantoinase